LKTSTNTGEQKASSERSQAWEAAYLRFETPEEEKKKFIWRLNRLGASDWQLDAEILELFCGRANGLHALSSLGFRHIVGADISSSLLSSADQGASLVICDGRQLPLQSGCRDIIIVQGGLHHLPDLSHDLEATLVEINRILRPDGLFVAVEPWLTPFLSLVHAACKIPLLTRLSSKLDAFAEMWAHEKVTYDRWLECPDIILRLLYKYFSASHLSFLRGKLYFVGKPRR